MPDYPDDELLVEQMVIPLATPVQSEPAPVSSPAGKRKTKKNANEADMVAADELLPHLDLKSASEEMAKRELPPPPSDEQLLSPVTPDYSLLLQEKDSGGIEILVQMAQKGELDPKNIDIIDATDRFLRAVAAAPRENLRQSGKIIFHASVLLRLKAEALLITRIEDLDAITDDFMDFDTEGSPIIYDSNDEAVGRQITLADLQRALVRRSKQQNKGRQRRVTLEQLIESLREAERLEKKRLERKEREPKALIQMDGYHAMEDMADILDLAHDEDIETVIVRIEQLLVKVMEDMIRLTLKDLIGMMNGRGDWVDAFLACLFLSNAGKINLEQDVFYGPLYLVKNDGADALTATGTDGNGLPGNALSPAPPIDESVEAPVDKDNVIELPLDKKKVTKKKIAAKSTKKPRPKKIIKPKQADEGESGEDEAGEDIEDEAIEDEAASENESLDEAGTSSDPEASSESERVNELSASIEADLSLEADASVEAEESVAPEVVSEQSELTEQISDETDFEIDEEQVEEEGQ